MVKRDFSTSVLPVWSCSAVKSCKPGISPTRCDLESRRLRDGFAVQHNDHYPKTDSPRSPIQPNDKSALACEKLFGMSCIKFVKSAPSVCLCTGNAVILMPEH